MPPPKVTTQRSSPDATTRRRVLATVRRLTRGDAGACKGSAARRRYCGAFGRNPGGQPVGLAGGVVVDPLDAASRPSARFLPGREGGHDLVDRRGAFDPGLGAIRTAGKCWRGLGSGEQVDAVDEQGRRAMKAASSPKTAVLAAALVWRYFRPGRRSMLRTMAEHLSDPTPLDGTFTTGRRRLAAFTSGRVVGP